jgi:hypothetical protein
VITHCSVIAPVKPLKQPAPDRNEDAPLHTVRGPAAHTTPVKVEHKARAETRVTAEMANMVNCISDQRSVMPMGGFIPFHIMYPQSEQADEYNPLRRA